MKRTGLVLIILAVGALQAQPVAAADVKVPAKQAKRHHAPKPYAHRHHKHHHAWTCNKYGNCLANWGWGMQTPSGRVAAVIVARGDVPVMKSDYVHYKRACAPQMSWNGYRWVKQWDRC